MANDNLLYDVTYRRIKDDIMDLTLEPGAVLSVRKFAERYGVSRTPAREAVIRLYKENLVNVYPQSKTIVSKIDLKRVEEERFILRALELSMVDDFLARCSPLVIDAMEYTVYLQKKYLKSHKLKDFIHSDDNFHRLLFETADKSFTWSTINIVLSHYNRLRVLATRSEALTRQVIRGHDQILKAVKVSDAAGTRKLLSAHLECIHAGTEDLLKAYPQYFTNLP